MDRNIFRRFGAIAVFFAAGALWASGEGSDDSEAALPIAIDLSGPSFPSSQDLPDLVSNAIETKQSLAGREVFFETWRDRPEVKKYLDYFAGPVGRNWILDSMRRSRPFKDFIIDVIASKSLPRELYFLVFVESTFDVDAVSRSGAAGLWQFMLNSLGNMRTDEWIDERFDFWNSTLAALEKLAYNYSVLKDWLLALAAYNAGLGRIQRLAHKYAGESFWDLSKHSDFPPETREYVPRILAAGYIGSHPVRYGFPAIWSPATHWQKIAVGQSLNIRDLEKKAAIPDNMLLDGNAELRFETTPPGLPLYYIKIPASYKDKILQVLGKMLPAANIRIHIVVSGDTLYSISKKYSVPEEVLLTNNPAVKAKALVIGESLIIPLPAPSKNAETNK